MYWFLQLTLLFLFASGAYACEDPNKEGFNKPTSGYEKTHQVSHVGEGLVNTSDTLLLWDRTENSTCFYFQTIHSNAHLCWLVGEAIRTGPNTYEYKDSHCKVRLKLGERLVRVLVDDPSEPGRKFCNPADTYQYACGFNTGIAPGVFRSIKGK